MSRVAELREELAHQERRIGILHADAEALLAKIAGIRADLAKDAGQYRREVGGGRDAYDDWRKRARRALVSAERKAARTQQRLGEAYQEKNLTNMMILSYESGYRGADSLGLLRATYLLLMKVVAGSGYQPDADELGLISTVQIQCGYDIPGGEHD